MAIGNITIEQAGGGNVIGVIPTSGSGVFFPTVLYRYANLTLPYSPNDPGLTFTYDNSSLAPVVLLYARFFNLLNESSASIVANVGTSAFVVSGAVSFSGGNCLDVRAFGAVGDGVTDDTAAIQSALNQAALNFLGNQQSAGQGNSATSRPVQSIASSVQNGSSSTLAVSLPFPVTVGDTLVLVFTAFDYGGGPNSPATPTVTSTGISGSWQQVSRVQNGEILTYMYAAQISTAQLMTVIITLPSKNFNSYIAAILTEFTGVLVPLTVDAEAHVVVPNQNFLSPTLPATGHGDLVIYSVFLPFAQGQQPVPPGDFTFLNYVPVLQPNGLNGAVPVVAAAYKNWTGQFPISGSSLGSFENWKAIGYGGNAAMVAFRLVSAPAGPPGKTIVCIPPGVNCMVSPRGIDRPIPGAPWFIGNSKNPYQIFPQYGPIAYSLSISDGVTLEIDGSLIANPNANLLTVPGGGVNTAVNVILGWALITNSAWLQNTELGSLTLLPGISEGSLYAIIPWNNYLNGTAFKEGPRNSGITVTGIGKVYLNGSIQASLPTALPPNAQLSLTIGYGLSPMAFLRFYCADNSTVSNLEIINPWGLAVQWGHSVNAKVDNLYIHDAAVTSSVQAIFKISVSSGGLPVGLLDGLVSMDMLRSSKVTNNRALNCPFSLGVADWAGYQDVISGNTWTNCLGGYGYVDIGMEWKWSFGVPYTAGVPTPNKNGFSFTAVTQNSEITQNTAINCTTAAPQVVISGQQNSPYNIEVDLGSDGFGFQCGIFAMGISSSGLGSEEIPVTGISLHDNIANGNSTDLFFGPLTTFRSLVNNSFGSSNGTPISNGLNTVTGEVLSGTVDGVNVIFTLAHIPQTSTLNLFLNGLLETLGVDYTVAGNQLTLAVAPNPGSVLSANYQYLSGN